MAKLTDQFIRSLQVPEAAKDVQAFDDELPGFGARKFASGKTSLFVKYSVGTQQRRKTLGPWVAGTLPAIRKEAAVVVAQARLGKDVVGEARKAQHEAKKAKKLGELVSPYLELRERGDEFWKPLREKSHREVTRYLEKSWKPLHDAPVNQITRQMVRDRRNELISESGAVSANRALAALSGLCGWAIEQEYIAGTNPTSDIKPLHQQGRDRVLSEEELVEIWIASGDDEFGRIVKLLMLTGQRRMEIGGLEWAELRLQRALIDLPERRTKNHKRHLVPLGKPALALIGEPPENPPTHVFGNFVSWSAGKALLDKRILGHRERPLPHWTLHDIRRTFVTNMNELGFAEPHIVEAIVNHISGSKSGVAGRYNHAQYLEQRRDALDKWGRYLTGLVGCPLSQHQRNNTEKSGENRSELASGTR
ncbi:MAG TPA: tyrosine-type recombinase/integrase [Hyphomicrobiaceae bacterium]|jgi:integrase